MLLREIVGNYSRRIHFLWVPHGTITSGSGNGRAYRIMPDHRSGTWTMLRFREPNSGGPAWKRNATTAQSNIWLTFRLIGLSSEFIRDRHPQYSHSLDQRIFRLAVDDCQVLQYALSRARRRTRSWRTPWQWKEQGGQQHDKAFFRSGLALQIERVGDIDDGQPDTQLDEMQREKRSFQILFPGPCLPGMPVHILETMATSMAMARNGVMPIHSLTTAVTALKEMAGNCRLYFEVSEPPKERTPSVNHTIGGRMNCEKIVSYLLAWSQPSALNSEQGLKNKNSVSTLRISRTSPVTSKYSIPTTSVVC